MCKEQREEVSCESEPSHVRRLRVSHKADYVTTSIRLNEVWYWTQKWTQRGKDRKMEVRWVIAYITTSFCKNEVRLGDRDGHR